MFLEAGVNFVGLFCVLVDWWPSVLCGIVWCFVAVGWV